LQRCRNYRRFSLKKVLSYYAVSVASKAERSKRAIRHVFYNIEDI